MKIHHGYLLTFSTKEIASFHLDEKGLDIEVDIEIGRTSSIVF